MMIQYFWIKLFKNKMCNECMPRKAKSLNENTYHYLVEYADEFHGLTEKYFRTCQEIEDTFGICRQTIYNYYMGLSKTKKNTIIKQIKKLNPPVERYKKIVVNFD